MKIQILISIIAGVLLCANVNGADLTQVQITRELNYPGDGQFRSQSWTNPYPYPIYIVRCVSYVSFDDSFNGIAIGAVQRADGTQLQYMGYRCKNGVPAGPVTDGRYDDSYEPDAITLEPGESLSIQVVSYSTPPSATIEFITYIWYRLTP